MSLELLVEDSSPESGDSERKRKQLELPLPEVPGPEWLEEREREEKEGRDKHGVVDDAIDYVDHNVLKGGVLQYDGRIKHLGW